MALHLGNQILARACRRYFPVEVGKGYKQSEIANNIIADIAIERYGLAHQASSNNVDEVHCCYKTQHHIRFL